VRCVLGYFPDDLPYFVLFVCIGILTMVFKVYANQGSELTKVLVTAKYAGVNVEVASGEVTPDLLAKNPTGKIPTLETSEGVIFESNAIVRYSNFLLLSFKTLFILSLC
jgi:hypothetical protein